MTAQQRLSAVYFAWESVDAGDLMPYGPRYRDGYRVAAGYVGRILMGARTDLPVHRSTCFELIVGIETPRALDLDIPQSR